MNFAAATERVLQNIPATLSVTFVDQHGVASEPGTVTVAVTRADGTVLLAAGTAATDPGTADGLRTVALTAAQTGLLDHLECTWTASTGQIMVTLVDVVGGYYFTLADLAALDGMTGLSNPVLRAARQSAEELVEERTGWCWVPRLAVDTVPARQFTAARVDGVSYSAGHIVDRLPGRALRAVKIDGVAETLSNWEISRSGLVASRASSVSTSSTSVEVIYEAGENGPPVSMTQAIMDAARQTHVDRKSGHSRALGVTNEFGNISYARATVENLFGTPAVDAVLGLWDQRIPGLA